MKPYGITVQSPTIGTPALGSLPRGKMRRARRQYIVQVHNARHRKIGFRFDFASWIALWIESGVYHMRGRHRGEYVMARPLDRGDYEIGNVVFVTTGDNVSECHTGKLPSAATRAKVGAKAKARLREGSPHLAELRAIRRSPRMRRLVGRNSKKMWAARRRAEEASP
jgi:hypothetical protein